jgi:hypothetical protein
MPAQLTEITPGAYKASLDGTYLGKVIRENHGGLVVWVAVGRNLQRRHSVFETPEQAGDQMAVDHLTSRAKLRRV